MSSQGSSFSVSADKDGRELLEAWGVWARSGSLGLGYKPIGIWAKPTEGSLFTDAELMAIDAVIAGLPPSPKWVIKQVFLHHDYRGVASEDIQEAIGRFYEGFFEGEAGVA